MFSVQWKYNNLEGLDLQQICWNTTEGNFLGGNWIEKHIHCNKKKAYRFAVSPLWLINPKLTRKPQELELCQIYLNIISTMYFKPFFMLRVSIEWAVIQYVRRFLLFPTFLTHHSTFDSRFPSLSFSFHSRLIPYYRFSYYRCPTPLFPDSLQSSIKTPKFTALNTFR